MKDRKTQGFRADAAETAALTLPDHRATGRIFKAVDYEHDKPELDLRAKREDARFRQRKHRAIKRVSSLLGEECGIVVKAFLSYKGADDINMPEAVFCDRLKKVIKFFNA